jgi:hypothetical protein
MAGLSALEALIARGPDTSPALMLPWQDAQTEIVKALGITRETALMVLYGLCATANLRCFTADRQIIDTDQGPLVIEGKIAFVEADDIRHWLLQSSQAPLTDQREIVIAELLASDQLPGENIEWKPFCDLVRDRCNGWRKRGKPTWGFGDKQIKRVVKTLRSQ